MPALIGDVSGTGGLRQKRGEETGERQSRDAAARSLHAPNVHRDQRFSFHRHL